ncbi:DUF3363 domain-containing protein [Streptomyces sp. NPDC002962]|uniref:DUF3363 domain-containing protein n=1 Tax=Streptomyces sp. NPDC002962 TaxID=3364674 RepID=UPI003691C9B4
MPTMPRRSCNVRASASTGRFAMIDDGLGFQLVPWTAALEGKLGRHVSGVARGDGGVDRGFQPEAGTEPIANVRCWPIPVVGASRWQGSATGPRSRPLRTAPVTSRASFCPSGRVRL